MTEQTPLAALRRIAGERLRANHYDGEAAVLLGLAANAESEQQRCRDEAARWYTRYLRCQHEEGRLRDEAAKLLDQARWLSTERNRGLIELQEARRETIGECAALVEGLARRMPDLRLRSARLGERIRALARAPGQEGNDA